MKLATLCYLRQDGHTLMLHRVKKANDMHQGKWNGLGGKLEAGETPEACVIREVAEESGLHIEKPRLCGLITFPAFDGFDDWYVFVFTADTFHGSLIESPEGNLRWVPNAELDALPLWEGDRIFMRWLDQPRFFSACFVYEAGKLQHHEVHFY
ncbi:MAG: 8-oxo-dGTP diphosphatase [Anaerolineales bacterium]